VLLAIFKTLVVRATQHIVEAVAKIPALIDALVIDPTGPVQTAGDSGWKWGTVVTGENASFGFPDT
jgi:hypothetical protein